jgi:multidrug efflux pump subunit AcrB
MLTGEGQSYADLKARAEDIRQRLLRVPNVNKADIIGEQPQRIYIEFSHAKLATLGITPQQIFDSVARQNAVLRAGRSIRPLTASTCASPAPSRVSKPLPRCRCRRMAGSSGSATSPP